jgi:hypothetical protein
VKGSWKKIKEVRKMAISAIHNNVPLQQQNTITAKKTSNVATSQNTVSNADGDTLKLSGNTQNVAPKYTVYAPPKVAASSGDPALNPQIKSFLDKVANGTATNQDMKDMQNVAQKDLGAISMNSTVANNTHASQIKNFLTKIANGTATDADLKSMQDILKQSQQQVNSPSGSGTDTTSLK